MPDFIRMLAEVDFYTLVITFCLFIVCVSFNTQSKIILISSEIISDCWRCNHVSSLAGVLSKQSWWRFGSCWLKEVKMLSCFETVQMQRMFDFQLSSVGASKQEPRTGLCQPRGASSSCCYMPDISSPVQGQLGMFCTCLCDFLEV